MPPCNILYIYTLFFCTPPWEVNGVRAGSLVSIACIAAGLVTRDPNRELDMNINLINMNNSIDEPSATNAVF